MGPEAIRRLAALHEIGGHTTHHIDLTTLNAEEARNEIIEGKRQLEDIIGSPLQAFAFPKGKRNVSIDRMVEEGGFKFGRTISAFHCTPSSGFLMHTTLQAYPHKRTTYLKNAVRRMNGEGLTTYIFRLHLGSNWMDLARKAFDLVAEEGGTWHLWGHSWEIEENNLWGDLEAVFDYVSGRTGVRYLTNGEAVDR